MRARRPLRLAFAVVASALATLTVASGTVGAASLPAGSTAILSGAPSLLAALPAPVGSSGTARWSVSRDGRRVAFTSTSDGLLEGDDDGVLNVYVKDRASGSAILVSRATGPGGEPSHADCFEPAVSDDGLLVAFTCDGALDPADTNHTDDVYVRDLASATTSLVSRAGGLGAVADGRAGRPALSATGEYVAFESEASNLDPSVSGGGSRVYRRQIGGANATIVASRLPAALGGSPRSGSEPSISDDGNRIAFTNFDTPGIDPLDTNPGADVYVRDVAAGTTVLASRAPGAGAVGNGVSRLPALAGDGSAVAFESQADNFDFSEDTDTEPDVYWRSLAGSLTSQNTALVSISAAGDKGFVSTAPSIDSSGNVVGFLSQATALDPADASPAVDAYVKNLVTNELHVASRADGAAGPVANADAVSVAVSGDGTKVAAGLADGRITPDVDPRQASVILRDLAAVPQHTFAVARPAGDAPFVNQGGGTGGAVLSADGRFAAFESSATGLGLPQADRGGIVVRDRVTGTITLASREDGATGAPFTGPVSSPAISADGRRVAFTVVDESQQRRVWARDLAAGRTWLASRADGAGGATASGSSSAPSLDGDGSRVAFESRAANLGDGDSDSQLDVHVRDLDTDRTILVSRGDGAAGPKGDGQSSGVDLSADGTRATFVSRATNLGDGDADQQTDAHLRDLTAQTTRLVSASPDGVKANKTVSRTSIDASGLRAAFETQSTNLAGASAPDFKVFVRDLAAGTLVLASRADGADGAPADGDASDSVISPDGGYVAFVSDAANLAGDQATGVLQVYSRDLAGGRTELISRGPAGAAASRRASGPDVSERGGCVSFSTSDALLGPPSDFTQAYLRVLRADCAAAEPPPGAGAGASGEPAAVTRDTVAPVLSRVRLSRPRLRVGPEATAISSAIGRGTVLSFDASEAGTLSVAFDRVLPGRRTGGHHPTCRPAKRRIRRRACSVHRRTGALTRRIEAGAGRVALSGRLGPRSMAAGTYQLALVARDAAGNRSKAVPLKLTIVKR